jgi:hypothetical protein
VADLGIRAIVQLAELRQLLAARPGLVELAAFDAAEVVLSVCLEQEDPVIARKNLVLGALSRASPGAALESAAVDRIVCRALVDAVLTLCADDEWGEVVRAREHELLDVWRRT